MPDNHTRQIVNKAWSFAHLLRDDGLSYMAYTEQITFLLFLKMAHQRTQPPWNRAPVVPDGLDWPSLLARDGEELETHYRRILTELPKQGRMLGEIFKKARQEIQNPATLKRLIVDLIDPEDWMSMHADVKGDIYEGLLAKSAQESPKGAGQYFTPRTCKGSARTSHLSGRESTAWPATPATASRWCSPTRRSARRAASGS